MVFKKIVHRLSIGGARPPLEKNWGGQAPLAPPPATGLTFSKINSYQLLWIAILANPDLIYLYREIYWIEGLKFLLIGVGKLHKCYLFQYNLFDIKIKFVIKGWHEKFQIIGFAHRLSITKWWSGWLMHA